MKSLLEVARLFSGGKFEEVEPHLSENIEWFIFEDDRHLSGKEALMKFGRSVASYFASVTTDFQEYGVTEGSSSVSIYGHARFIKDSIQVNEVNSCDVYEFDANGMITKIYSYCNSKK